MKKNILYVLIMIIGMVFTVPVFAEEEEDLCPLETKTNLRVAASNVTVNYQPIEVAYQNELNVPADSSGAVEYFFDVKIYNVNSDLMVKIKSDDEFSQGTEVTYKNIQKDGAIHAKKRVGNELTNLVFEIYGSQSTGGCAVEVLRTIKLTLPKYNNLAEREVCTEVPEFYMCQKYVTYDIDPANFSKEIAKYKEKLEQQQNASNTDVEDNNTLPDKAADLISKNKLFIVGAIVLAGIIITVIILRRKKSVL